MVSLFFNNQLLIFSSKQRFHMFLEQIQPHIGITEFFFKSQGSALDPAEIHHIIYDIDDMFCRSANRLQALTHHLFVPDIFLRDICHPNNCIQGIFHFLTDLGKKLRLTSIFFILSI